MGKMTNRQRLRIWIACFAILLNALVPSLSQAVNAIQGQGALLEICSAGGAKYVARDGAPTSPTLPRDAALHHMQHCPCCLGDASSPPMPPRLAGIMPVAPPSNVFPSLFHPAPAALFAWSPSRARAPPAR